MIPIDIFEPYFRTHSNGDGWTARKDRQCFFSTMCFSFDECYCLVDKLVLLGIYDCGVQDRRGRPEICVYASSFDKFMNMVHEHIPVNCMRYKIRS